MLSNNFTKCHFKKDAEATTNIGAADPTASVNVTSIGAAVVAAAACARRVAAIAITDTTFEGTVAPEDQVAVLMKVLAQCVVPAEQRARVCFGSGNNNNNFIPPTALLAIVTEFSFSAPANTAVIGPLSTDFPMMMSSLEVLTLTYSDLDESAALGAFATLATHLRNLTLQNCRLTSVQGLEGCCKYLRSVDFNGCIGGFKHLRSLSGLEKHLYLEEVNASFSLITSIEPLLACPALTKVDLYGCRQLASIEGLQDHLLLQEVNLSDAVVSSIEPLRSCPSLTKVLLYGCRQLASIDALEHHQWLREVDASRTAITSLEPLRSCPALSAVSFCHCLGLSSMEGLEGHQLLREVDARGTALSSIEPLRTCPALMLVDLRSCQRLPADIELPVSVDVMLD